MRRRDVLLLLGVLPLLARTRAEAHTVRPRKEVPPGDFLYADYDALLRKHVDPEGRVDYRRLLREDRDQVEALYAALAAHPPFKAQAYVRKGPARSEALAFYLCAHNLLTWKGILDRLAQAGEGEGVSLTQDRLVFLCFTRYLVAGEPLSLEELSRRQILPLFADARVHFALHFGAMGCPQLPQEAFVPDRVEAQLDERAGRFLNDHRNVDPDPASGVLRLSPLLWWHRNDFAADEAALLAYINRFRPDDTKLADHPPPRIKYLDFDWGLNSRS